MTQMYDTDDVEQDLRDEVDMCGDAGRENITMTVEQGEALLKIIDDLRKVRTGPVKLFGPPGSGRTLQDMANNRDMGLRPGDDPERWRGPHFVTGLQHRPHVRPGDPIVQGNCPQEMVQSVAKAVADGKAVIGVHDEIVIPTDFRQAEEVTATLVWPTLDLAEVRVIDPYGDLSQWHPMWVGPCPFPGDPFFDFMWRMGEIREGCKAGLMETWTTRPDHYRLTHYRERGNKVFEPKPGQEQVCKECGGDHPDDDC